MRTEGFIWPNPETLVSKMYLFNTNDCFLLLAPTPQNHHISLVCSQKTLKNSRLCGKGPFWTKTVDPCFGIWPYSVSDLTIYD